MEAADWGHDGVSVPIWTVYESLMMIQFKIPYEFHLFQVLKARLEVMEAADLGCEGKGKTSIPIGTFPEGLMLI